MEDYERSEAVDCAEETGRFQHQSAQQEKLTARESAALASIRGAIDPLWSEEVVLERFKKLVGGVLVPDVDHSLREHVHEGEGATGRQDRRERMENILGEGAGPLEGMLEGDLTGGMEDFTELLPQVQGSE